jgi:hypothetical protein
MAIAKPDVMATQFVPAAAASPAVCANAPGASRQTPAIANSPNRIFLVVVLIVVFLLTL